MNRKPCRKENGSFLYKAFLVTGFLAFFGMLGIGTYTLYEGINSKFKPTNGKVDLTPTPENARFGWVEKESETETSKQIRAELPKFSIKGAEPNSWRGQRAYLWHFSQLVLGKHLPTFRQEIGDCVSMGAANAANYLQCVQIALGNLHEFHPAYQPYIYGISRVQIGGGRISGDGSVGAWAAKGMQKYGILRADLEGVPPYSGTIARQWGRSGPPQKWIDEGIKYPIQQFSQVNTWDDCVAAIANGYPITIASNVGFEGGSYTKDGKLFLRRGSSWGHQMACIGIDDASDTKAAYIINSWGENAHPAPLNGEPKGGFWIIREDLVAIIKQQDSYAFSAFKGFPAQRIDWDVISFQTGGSFDGRVFSTNVSDDARAKFRSQLARAYGIDGADAYGSPMESTSDKRGIASPKAGQIGLARGSSRDEGKEDFAVSRRLYLGLPFGSAKR